MPVERIPSGEPAPEDERLRELPPGHFVVVNGEKRRLPTTMLRPLTWREAMLGRVATSTDIIGVETVLREADELREYHKQLI